MAQLKNTTISGTGSIGLPTGTTAQRPSSPSAGMIRYNTTIADTEYYDGAAWRPLSDSNPEATGGTIVDTDIGGVPYRIHLFTNTGNTNFVVTKGGEIEYLIVAGGGSGGGNNRNGGGGGGGGVLTGVASIAPQTYTITVGDGGQPPGPGPSGASAPGRSGDNSSAFGLTAIGGGHGGSWISHAPAVGGSGGGAGSHTSTEISGANGTAGQGNRGGDNAVGAGGRSGGGGGGAGLPGADAVFDKGANGGMGILNSITGISKYYSGGGAAGRRSVAGLSTQGGLGGGGNFVMDVQRFNGISNTGGGGGAAGTDTADQWPGAGGSGIVIVRYRRNRSTTTAPTETRPSSQPFFYNRDMRTITARTGLVLELDAANPIGHINDTWIDLSSRSRNPTVLGSLDFTGNSLRFPGDRTNFVEHTDFYNNNTADSIFIGVPPQSTSNWSGDCTYIAWVNPGIIDGTLRHVFSDNNYNEGELEFVNGGLRFSWGSGNGFTSGDIGLTPNRWYQVVQTHQRRDFDDIFRYEGFLNGNRLFSTTRLISTSASSYGPDVRLTIGPDFVGEMSLVQVYDRVLSDEEIRQNYIAFTTRYGG